MNIELRVNHFIIWICFDTPGSMPLPLHATSIILPFVVLPDMVGNKRISVINTVGVIYNLETPQA